MSISRVYCAIYIVKNEINKKCYVGQTWQPMLVRWRHHCYPKRMLHCVKLGRAIAKYGKSNFSINLLTICSTQEVANYYEKFFINQFDSIKNGYNTLEGGGFSRIGTKHSIATRSNMSKNRKGSQNSNSVLTLDRVLEIRKDFENFSNAKTGSKYGAITSLSKKYKVSITCIWEIVTKKAWND